jgi:hypothetical protein
MEVLRSDDWQTCPEPFELQVFQEVSRAIGHKEQDFTGHDWCVDGEWIYLSAP